MSGGLEIKVNHGNSGGNITLIAGETPRNLILSSGFGDPPGSIILQVPDADDNKVERLRIDPDGSFYVEGRKVTTDHDVYEAFSDWMGIAVRGAL